MVPYHMIPYQMIARTRHASIHTDDSNSKTQDTMVALLSDPIYYPRRDEASHQDIATSSDDSIPHLNQLLNCLLAEHRAIFKEEPGGRTKKRVEVHCGMRGCVMNFIQRRVVASKQLP